MTRALLPAHHHRLRFRALIVIVAILAPLLVALAPAAAASTATAERSLAATLLSLINAERHAHHLPAVQRNARLDSGARAHSLLMAQHNRMSHQLPGEAGLARRVTRTGFRWHYAAENIAWNSVMSRAGVTQVQRMMYTERPPDDGHRLAILGRRYHYVGISVILDYRHHKVWLTTDFASH